MFYSDTIFNFVMCVTLTKSSFWYKCICFFTYLKNLQNRVKIEIIKKDNIEEFSKQQSKN